MRGLFGGPEVSGGLYMAPEVSTEVWVEVHMRGLFGGPLIWTSTQTSISPLVPCINPTHLWYPE